MPYELDKLSGTGDFSLDMENILKNFVGYSSCFGAFDDFVQNAPGYLSGYTPAVVAFSDEVRRQFLRELDEIQRVLITLGMMSAASKLTDLRNAANRAEVEILEDGLRVFRADMVLAAKKISAVRA